VSSAPPTGLCAACRHHRWISSRRGSSFLLCRRSVDDPRFPRYPPLPVVACAGFEPGTLDRDDATTDPEAGGL
jgi:hypothetical protein